MAGKTQNTPLLGSLLHDALVPCMHVCLLMHTHTHTTSASTRAGPCPAFRSYGIELIYICLCVALAFSFFMFTIYAIFGAFLVLFRDRIGTASSSAAATEEQDAHGEDVEESEQF